MSPSSKSPVVQSHTDIRLPSSPVISHDISGLEKLLASVKQRYKASFQLKDAEEMVSLSRQLLSLSQELGLQDDSHSTPPRRSEDPRTNLAYTVLTLWEHTPRDEDLEEVIKLCRSVLADVDPATIAYIHPAKLAAVALRRVHDRTDDRQYIVESVDLLEKAMKISTEKGHSGRLLLISEVSQSFMRLHSTTRNLSDLDSMISLNIGAEKSCPSDNIDYFSVVWSLANSLLYRQEVTGDISDLELAERYAQEATSKCNTSRPNSHSLFSLLARICICRLRTFEDGAPDATRYRDQAIEHTNKALSYPSQALIDRVRSLCDLGILLREKYANSRQPADLNRANECMKEALEKCPSSHLSVRVHILFHYGSINQYMAWASGQPSYLDDGIHFRRMVCGYAPEGMAHAMIRAGYLTGLVMLLWDRWKALQDFEDLEEVIFLSRTAIDIVPSGTANFTGTASYLIPLALGDRYNITHTEADLNDIKKFVNALEEIHGSRVPQANRLGPSLRRLYADVQLFQFSLTKNVDYLNAAIQNYDVTLEGYPPQGLYRDRVCGSLARALLFRCQEFDDAVDSQRAFDLLLKLVNDSARRLVDADVLINAFFGLALLFATPITHTWNFQQALHTVKYVIGDKTFLPLHRLQDGLLAMEYILKSQEENNWSHDQRAYILDIYQQIINLLPQAANIGQHARKRLRVLALIDQAASDGASLSLRLGKAEVAVEMIDNGRTTFWSQLLRPRHAFDYLPPELAEELKAVAEELEEGNKNSLRQVGALHTFHEKAQSEREAVKLRILGEKFDELTERARTQPGLERFMLYEPYEFMSKAATRGPIVILLADKTSAHIILIRTPDAAPEHEELARVTYNSLTDMTNRLGTRARRGLNVGMQRAIKVKRAAPRVGGDVLADLWHDVMLHVITKLGFKRRTGRHRPRIFLCATGAFARLPMHASGVYQAQSDYCSQYCVTSYIPTIGSLLSAQSAFMRVRRDEATTFLAAVPDSPGMTRLDNVAEEVDGIRQCIPPSAILACYNSSPKAQDVTDALPKTSVLHLACHGIQDLASPLDSGFVMRDQLLKMSDIMALRLPRAFFAFLSACETAKGDQRLPDQAVHLAAAMLFAGFKSVIGTMWSMGDVDGPIVAQRVYNELFAGEKEYLDPDDIPYALDAAVSDLRAQGLTSVRWAPYVHIGI